MNPQKFRGKMFFDFKPDSDKDFEFLMYKLHQFFESQNYISSNYNNKQIEGKSDRSLFGLMFSFKISLNPKNTNVLDYEFDFGEYYMLSVLFSLFAMFFISISFWLFFVLALIFTFFFISVNIAFINNYIKKTIVSTLNNYIQIFDNTASIPQQKWITQKNICPGCGKEINKYMERCVNCGISLSGKKSKKITNTTYNIDYKYDILKK